MAYTTKNVALAWRVLRSEDGRRALDRGWGLALWEFVAMHGREPTTSEGEGLRKSAARVRRNRGSWPEMARLAHERKEKRVMEGVYGRE